ncbi:Rieske 2Fe-2S domain-containing protein [filamentous cyanobacterium LEGE 11480]|uniref:Rieske 2Fe-2S domain-containing protein n=1 Tax=Romeriopsis navalis LEGE 11480 TaxID=2777977 RepID=A0A928Z5N8_9CYAN|nr:Rieske 2Fe-2S domain-containing protein [Romeriopsis navalis]MBE9032177.1 Rieske 2Fe-2S domain-containing protein [Romeriopsis navalis LEGE 11480]
MNSNKFDFFQHWYPIAPITDLKSDRPSAVMILGQQLVVWKPPNSETFRVFIDQCPHRLAPLSEGRIDDKTGHLMCSYHGWQFDDAGACSRIPQAEDDKILQTQKDNFCVTSLPTQTANGLLWVWPDATSKNLATTQPLPLSPQLDSSSEVVYSSMVRDLAYDWQTLVENVADPSHVPFAHHGVQGNRDRAKPVPMKVVESDAKRIKIVSNGIFQSTITFTPPCHLEYEMQFGSDHKKLGLITYCIPVSPGKSRIVAQFSRNFAQRLHHWIPRWWNHINERNPVLDGDMILLHNQERCLQARSESWQTAYKMPTQADRMVVEFRRWLDRDGPSELPWGKLTDLSYSSAADRATILDRYHQHTKICSSCSQALKYIQRTQLGLQIYFILALAITAVLPDSLRLHVGLPFIITGLAGLGLYGWLKYRLEPQFYFVDYVHPDR